VFVSYGHGDTAHEEQVRVQGLFLRAHGIDARLDVPGRRAARLAAVDDGAGPRRGPDPSDRFCGG
jgi:hypothetical protein